MVTEKKNANLRRTNSQGNKRNTLIRFLYKHAVWSAGMKSEKLSNV
jgi:hypothetical protein